MNFVVWQQNLFVFTRGKKKKSESFFFHYHQKIIITTIKNLPIILNIFLKFYLAKIKLLTFLRESPTNNPNPKFSLIQRVNSQNVASIASLKSKQFFSNEEPLHWFGEYCSLAKTLNQNNNSKKVKLYHSLSFWLIGN